MSRTLRPTRLRFRHLAAATTGLTFLLILLGVYTAATASGLACSGQWPLCDGGLLPQSIPSFIEWVHRFVAMITGFAILGTTVWAWRRSGSGGDGRTANADAQNGRDAAPRSEVHDDARIRWAATLALVVLPVQVVLGGLTVGIYQPLVNTLHHAAALVIFAALLAATLWAFDAGSRDGGNRRRDGPGATADD